MKMHVLLPLALCCAALPSYALAQVTQSFTYDGNGRLVGVTTTGAGATNTATYAYDDANNRTSRTQTGSSAWAALLELPAQQWLQPNEALVSPDGRYSLAVRESGQLELWRADEGASTASAAAAAFQLDASGKARFRHPEWSASDFETAVLTLANSGDLILSDAAGAVLWSSLRVEGSDQ